jgi:ATP-binding cassette subfamily B protein
MPRNIKKNERPKVPFGKVVRFGLAITFKSIPVLFIAINIVAVIHGISHAFAVVMTQRFYDSVEAVLAGTGAMRGAYFAVAALALTMLSRELLNGTHNFMHSVCFNKMHGEMAKIIHGKMARIDPVCLEDPRLHDDINKAQEGSGTIFYVIGIGATILTFYLPYFAFMAVYLYYLKPLFIVSMALVFIPTLIGQLMRTNIMEKFEDKAAPVRREFEAHEKAITHKTWFKETRLLGGYTYFLKLLTDTMRRLAGAEWEANRRTNLINLGMNMLTLAGNGGIIYMLFDALLKGEISVGAFAAVYGAIGMLFGIMDEIIRQHIGNIASSLGKAHNFIRFMELPERGGGACERKPQEGIIIEDASFRYPNAQADSVSGINLRIKAGETIAVVGENGAGKTTLARLLTGIYKPSTGRVVLSGMDTSTTDAAHLFDSISGVFQKYQRYQMTLRDNVRISGFESSADIEPALSEAGVNYGGESFPKGTDTMLSREFEGVDLSGGEWQRVAIARGLYRVHDIILLDEPTAAIDPLEESRIYRQFIEMSREKTAIIITHRLGSTQIADRVLVMDKGRIAGDGTHESLMTDCELYRNMYNAQAEWYSTETAVKG